jgi:hypothetical protein
MKDDVPVVDGLADRVAQAIDRVQHDIEMVAFWACAFGGLVRPIPDYRGVTVLTKKPRSTDHTRIGIST